MTDAVITEYAGTRKNNTITRYYQYGSGGVRVLDGKKNLKRLYRFDPASDTMTEHDPARPDRILRRFIFDRMGMLEETFSPGEPPRKFSYEQGGWVITVREGGRFGQVGKTFSFEGKGISETEWGRDGEIERVYLFEDEMDTVTIRAGGWFGEVLRTIFFEGINIAVFREPEAFLQFLMFTEWSAMDEEDRVRSQVNTIRQGSPGVPGRKSAPAGRAVRDRDREVDIEFIPDSEVRYDETRANTVKRSDAIPFQERVKRDGQGTVSPGRSAEIPLQERFESSRQDPDPLQRGKSADIPLDERFGSSREKEELKRGGSVDIPLDERFELARREREKLSRGKSAEIPYSERRGDRD